MSTHTSGKTPDGKTVPVAWDLNSGKIYVKTAPYMPWGDEPAVTALVTAGGVYIPASEEWFRGVWEPAPSQKMLDADYTAALAAGQQPPLLEAGEDEEEATGDTEDEETPHRKNKRRR